MTKKFSAPYDYGHSDPAKLRSYRIKAYDLSNPSVDRPKVKMTGNYADNAMDDPSVVNEGTEESAVEKLHSMLTKLGITDEQIRDGVDLKQRGYHKVAAALGTSVEYVQSLLTTLVKSLQPSSETSKVLAELDDGRVEDFHMPSIMDEITSDIGTMDFPWTLGARKGVATAAYKSEGKNFYIKIARVRNDAGQLVQLTPEEKKQVRKQAIKFIGQE